MRKTIEVEQMRQGNGRIRLVAAIALATALTACGSPEEKARDYLESARAFVEQGDMKKADIELRNALKLDPRLAEAHYLRALVFESRKAFPEMYRELQSTVQIDENHLDAHLKLAQLHVAAGKPDEAQASVDRARAIAAGDYRVLRAQAMVHAREQRVEEALQEIREALALQPGDLDSQVMLGSLLLSSRDHEGAAQAIADGLAKHPESDALMLLDFQQHATQKRVDEAVQAMNRLIVQKPQELSYRQGLAAYLVSNERAAEAESVLRAAVAEMPQSLEAKLALVGLLAQRDQGAAVEALRGYIGQDGEGSARLRIALGELHERQSELDDAAAVYREVAASPEKEESLFARNQLARIALRQGKGDEAVALIEEILAGDSGNAEALLTRAGLRLGERRTEEAITDLRKVLGQDPSSVRAHVLLSRAHLQNGAVEMARASLVDALKIDPRNEAAVTQFAGLLIGEQRYDKALEVLQPLASAPDASKRVRALELQAKLAMKDWEGANAIAGDLGERAGNPDYAKYIEALGLQGQGRHEEAITRFREVLAVKPDMTGALAGIVRSYREQDKTAVAMDEVAAFVTANPTDAQARQLFVAELLRDRADERARAVLEEGLARDAAWIAGYRGLGELALRAGDQAAALAVYDRGLTANPQAMDLQLLAAAALERQGDRDGAIVRYRAVLESVPAADGAANNLAVLLAGDGTDPARLAEAFEIAKRFENAEQPFFADTYAWILYQQGNFARAATVLDRVVKRAPEEAIFRYHLGAALFRSNDMQTAKVHLQKAKMLAEEKGEFDGYADAMALLAQIP
ncbi:MAG: Beta-barrel assembly-enhancing protease [Pseudomonadales bacterium]|nr:Beta-barrel assembly-enhancing protease [Pseudomonadales bacterium]